MSEKLPRWKWEIIDHIKKIDRGCVLVIDDATGNVIFAGVQFNAKNVFLALLDKLAMMWSNKYVQLSLGYHERSGVKVIGAVCARCGRPPEECTCNRDIPGGP